jgi:hypothetical protein
MLDRGLREERLSALDIIIHKSERNKKYQILQTRDDTG